MGHVVSKSGVKTDPAKVQAVENMRKPTTVTQVRSFLGLSSYYRKFIKDYSKVAKPLFDLTKKDTRFIWDEECEISFQELKTRLITAPILAYPRANGSEFILDTDASAYAIGAVLSQVQDGKERVIAYGSRCLDKPERNYCVTRREMLAVVYFTKYFKHYLLGRGFKLRTDHGSLTWLQNFKDPDGQIHRWIQQLSQFHMKIEHRPGNRHGNADAMSRLKTETGIFCKQCEMPWDYIYDGPCHIEIKEMKEGEKTNCPVDTITNSGEFENSDEEVNDHCRSSPQQNSTSFSGFLIGQDDSVLGRTSKIKRGRKPNRPKQAKQIPQPDTDLTLEVIRDKQESDSILKQILKYKIEGRKPDWGEISYEISYESVHLKYWLARWESIEMKNGILCMYWDDDTKKGRWKICAPNSIEKNDPLVPT